MAPHNKHTLEQGEPLVQTTVRILELIDVVQDLDGATINEITEEVSLSKSSVYNHLTTLTNQGYLVKIDNEYFIGLKFLDHGIHAKKRQLTTRVVEPVMEYLAEETGELVWLSVEERGKKIFLEKVEGEKAIPTDYHAGSSFPLHSTASGKSILAHLPEAYVDEILDNYGMPQLTDETITDREDLYEELDTIRDRGYAFCDGETLSGLRAVAAPIVHNGEVEGAISISGPRSRFSGQYFQEELPELVSDASNEIEIKLSQSWFDDDWPS